ncbi:d-beta-hydroxybutyrate dehydrogenase, mitochondrial [Trichonephila clavipes]|nr:d-beta-hydroxybutyrate dehydrogenase, mitochondrial [Trichonephila clavipes]
MRTSPTGDELCFYTLRNIREIPSRIITISSVNGSIAYPGLTTYCATKFALEGFNNALRNEVGPQYGIRVITIQPGDYARITSIMSQHRRNMEEMWDAMSFQQQEQLTKYFQKYHQRVLQSYGLTSPTSWENSPLLHDVKEAVLAENPASKYLSAPFIHRLVYKLMITVPQSWADFLLIKVVHYIDKPEKSKQNGH